VLTVLVLCPPHWFTLSVRYVTADVVDRWICAEDKRQPLAEGAKVVQLHIKWSIYTET